MGDDCTSAWQNAPGGAVALPILQVGQAGQSSLAWPCLQGGTCLVLTGAALLSPQVLVVQPGAGFVGPGGGHGAAVAGGHPLERAGACGPAGDADFSAGHAGVWLDV